MSGSATPPFGTVRSRAGEPYIPGRRHAPEGYEPDPYKLGRDEESDAPGHGAGGPAGKEIVAAYGFWVFLLSDFIMFSAFFAAFAVLRGNVDGGPTARDLFDLPFVAVETSLLLASSFFCGLAVIAFQEKKQLWFQLGMAATGLFGAGFLAMEAYEFAHLVEEGAGPSRSAFLSSFFTLVGCHGLHVGVGLLWLGTMMAQVYAKGFRPVMWRRVVCFSLFWHALDIIWVAVFTIVYVIGVVGVSAAAQSSDAAQAGDPTPGSHSGDVAPGHSGPEHGTVFERIRGYVVGLILAALLTTASFTLHLTGLVYGPGLPVALLVLAVAQMGVHIVFFLHVTTGPDNTNNVLALAFGVLIVGLVVVGSLWIMANLDHNMRPRSTDGQPPTAGAPAGGHGGHRR